MTDPNHERFLRHLAESQDPMWLVAHWLHARGHSVTVHAAGRAKTHAEWHEYADAGDLSIAHRVEVKHLSANFTGRQDWPFAPHFIVCARHAWDHAAPKPYAFVYLSRDLRHVAFVLGESHDAWRIEKRRDHRYDHVEQEFYLCPLALVSFSRFDHPALTPPPASDTP